MRFCRRVLQAPNYPRARGRTYAIRPCVLSWRAVIDEYQRATRVGR